MIRFCVVGTNFISDAFAEAALELDAASITAVYSRKEDTGAHFAEKHGINKVFTDYEQALKSDLFDAVYIASPIYKHCEQTLMALKAGKHVLCEKSIAASLPEFLAMSEEAKRTGLVLLEAMRPAFSPAYLALRDAIPLVGKVSGATFEFCKYSSRYDSFKAGIITNAFDPSIKNSALLDIGVYPLWFALSLFGEPMGHRATSERLSNGFVGRGEAVFDYGDKRVTVTYSKIHGTDTPSVIVGSSGRLTVDSMNSPSEVIFYPTVGAARVIYRSAVKNDMVYEISAFCEMAEGKASNEEYLENSRMQMSWLDKIARS